MVNVNIKVKTIKIDGEILVDENGNIQSELYLGDILLNEKIVDSIIHTITSIWNWEEDKLLK